ncbi:DNA ligase D [soil metagenome]
MPPAKSSLKTYKEKRDFTLTAEPKGQAKAGKAGKDLSFVIQKHDATRLHFDFRLELDGVLKSWAVTRGPSLDPSEKRLAVRTEDHPIEYGTFEGTIPKGQYGGGTVMMWDRGTWTPENEPHQGLKDGKLGFTLHGTRLKGSFALVRMKPREGDGKRENWLLIKHKDETASTTLDPVAKYDRSVTTRRGMEAIAKSDKVWQSNRSGEDDESSAKPKRARKATPVKKKSRIKPGTRQPPFIEPQLAYLRDAPPSGDVWVHELKLDGYRLLASLAGDRVTLYTRTGQDWTHKFGRLEQDFAALDVSALIDGEAVVFQTSGRSDFSLLQKAISEGDREAFRFVAFDLLFENGNDLRSLSLEERKERLKDLLARSPNTAIGYSDHLTGDGPHILGEACKLGAEGLVSKDRTAPYASRRSQTWIKSKCLGRDEFVIGGYRPSDKKARSFASLLVGIFTKNGLEYRGRVGTGFDDALLEDLGRKLKARRIPKSPFVDVPRDILRQALWVKPELVAEIAYSERTADGFLRHPAFVGLREDKPAKEVTGSDRKMSVKDDEIEVGGVRLTHPDKVLFPDQGITKLELAEYLKSVSKAMLPYLANHPVSLVRCPDGAEGKCFFQKHRSAGMPDGFENIKITEKDGDVAEYLQITKETGLMGAAQIGALELHVWGSRGDDLEHPDRIVFDLDPAEDVDFAAVKTAAGDLRDLLEAAGLKSFPLLSGGKGVHIVVPLGRKNDWPEVKGFSEAIARGLAAREPARFLAVASKAKRPGKIFIDWLRNERGATAITPYSVRARKGAPVAIPVSWDELAKFKSANAFTMETAAKRVATQKRDPWEGYKTRQSISAKTLAAAQSAAD